MSLEFAHRNYMTLILSAKLLVTCNHFNNNFVILICISVLGASQKGEMARTTFKRIRTHRWEVCGLQSGEKRTQNLSLKDEWGSGCWRGNAGVSWLVSILPRANQVFFFFFLNKGTAIPFLVPTFPERKAIPVMWVVVCPHHCYRLCSAGLQVPAQGGMCSWGWVCRDPGDTILQVRWGGVDKGHFRDLSRGFNCKQRWAV